TSTQFWSAAGSSGGFGLPAIVVFRLRYNQPNAYGTGSDEPPTCVAFASAGNGKSVGFRGCGDTGKPGVCCGCSCSSKITMPSWPSGYNDGPLPAEQVNDSGTDLPSRQTCSVVPPLNAPPFRNRTAKSVANGSRWSVACQFT